MLENKNILIMGFGVTGKTALKFLKEFPCKIYVYDSNQDLQKLNVEEDFTGTNGKTITTTILGDILRRVAKTYVVGNIGRGILEITGEAKPEDYVVIEASSFQLENTIDFKPHIAVLTYVTSDHLDWHKTRQNYVDAKFKIFKNQNDFAILNYEDRDLAEKYNLKAEKYYFSMEKISEKGAYLDQGKIYFKDGEKTEEILDAKDIKIPGDHNIRNIMAAVIACKLLKIDLDIIKKSIESFTGVEHRIEFVREVDGVKYYNDSKGTNPDSTEVAVAAMDGDVVLIAGGYDKGADFDNLIEKSKDKLKTAILFGQTAEKISNSCKNHGVEFYITEDLKKAVELAKKLAIKGDDVLLSPACASWDMYKSYEVRGQHFKDLVKELM